MNPHFRFYALFFFCFIFFYEGLTQPIVDNFPKVGDRCPDFILHDLHYGSKKTASFADFKGKPLILDFFSEGCSACFRSFPKIDSLSKEFKGKIQFVLIAKRTSNMQKQYEKYMNHYKLTLPVEYDDSTLWNKFGVFHVPYTLWIDSTGIIKQVTVSFAMNSDRLNKFIQGIEQPLTEMDNYAQVKNWDAGFKFYDRKKPFLIGGNGGGDTSYSYRSIISKWDPRSGFDFDLFISSKKNTRLQEIGLNLENFYRLAYGDTVDAVSPLDPNEIRLHAPNHYGQWANHLVLETSRKDLADYDPDSVKNLFSYSLDIPGVESSAGELQNIMQRDLKNFFGFQVTVEKRLMPCWKLILLEGVKPNLRTRGGKTSADADFNTFTLVNQPVPVLLNAMFYMHQDDPVFIDETGIDYNIDIDMHCVFSDLNDIKRELRKNGLDLVKGEKEQKVIVLRDEPR